MHYTAYTRRTQEAASVVGGNYVSLAGGYYGVQLPADGTNLILALDLDGSSGWVVWTEDADGERCCDDNTVDLGWVPSDGLKQAALAAAAQHRCR
jgi:hypothetical protein